MVELYAGLPRPSPDSLVLYAFGPGFGESLVIGGPDDSWVVIDSCRADGQCVPLAFLRERGVTRLDAFVLTHADLDHVDGADELLSAMPVDRVIRFPIGDSLVALLATCLRERPGDERLARLRAALDAVDAFDEENRSVEATYRTREVALRQLRLDLLAPLESDRRAAREFIRRAIDAGRAELRADVVEWLQGDRDKLRGSWNNGLSVAMSVGWADHRVLLTGDLEVLNDARRGWKGLISVLREDGRLGLITGTSCVKVPHHGSRGAYLAEAWSYHADGRSVPAALLTPWNRGKKLPHVATLTWIGAHATTLALTSEEPAIRARRETAGWRARAGTASAGSAAVAVVLHRDKARPVEVFTTGAAGAWTR
jgi:beta-lactamase superfamily II metal-dependent hydrolase